MEDNYNSSNIRKDTINEGSLGGSGAGYGGTMGSPTDLSNASPYGSSSSGSGGGSESWRNKSFSNATPDEVREMVKDRVAKGIAAVTGALEGFVERSRRGELAQKTRQAIETAGETSREVISSTSEQVERTVSTANEKLQHTKKNVQDSGIKENASGVIQNAKQAMHKAGETARGVTRSAKEEAQKTKQELGGGSSGSSSKFGSSGSSSGMDMSTSSYNQQSDATSGVPDISNTKLGTQSDIKKAQGGSSTDRL